MDDPLLARRATVPDHVVRRRFAEESIALNLRTGQYHGLNETAARILDALEAGSPGAEIARELAAETGEARERVEADVAALLRALRDRDLVRLDDPGAG